VLFRSVGFRSGLVTAEGRIGIDPPTGFVTAPAVVANAQYDKELFLRKLAELGVVDNVVGMVFGELDDRFTLGDLNAAVGRAARSPRLPLPVGWAGSHWRGWRG
jgi:hypothetical protein